MDPVFFDGIEDASDWTSASMGQQFIDVPTPDETMDCDSDSEDHDTTTRYQSPLFSVGAGRTASHTIQPVPSRSIVMSSAVAPAAPRRVWKNNVFAPARSNEDEPLPQPRHSLKELGDSIRPLETARYSNVGDRGAYEDDDPLALGDDQDDFVDVFASASVQIASRSSFKPPVAKKPIKSSAIQSADKNKNSKNRCSIQCQSVSAILLRV